MDEVSRLMDRIARCPDPVDLSSLVFLLSNNVVCRVAFGSNGAEGGSREFEEILRETQHLVGEFNLADYFPGMDWVNRFNGVDRRLDKTFQDLDRFLDKVIQEHRDPMRPKSDVEDIIDVLLEIQKDKGRALNLKDEQIKGILLVVSICTG